MAREAWTGNRLDDLNARVGRLEERTDTGFAEMRQEFRALRSDLTYLTYGLIGTMLVGFLGTIAAIATQT
ncbi:MAG: hypothetical protein ACTHK3_03515 [Solirubrobacterales bacterium]